MEISGTMYIGETRHSNNHTILEHVLDIKHAMSCSSSLDEHAKNTNHHICIEEARFIARIDHFHHRKLRESLEIEGWPINLNRDNG